MRPGEPGSETVTHIHIPDGVLPVWLWAGGWVATLALLWVASAMASRHDEARKVALLGVVAALVLVSMSSEIVPIAYHINLTVVAGVLLGPWMGFIAAFIVVVMLALLGHGGVTVIGLNTLLIGTEVALGWGLFRGLSRLLGRARAGLSAGVATVITLALTTTLLVGIVALAGGGAATGRETGAFDPAALRFENPFSAGVFSLGTLRGAEAGRPEAVAPARLSVGRFAAVVFVLGPIGWVIEAIVSAAAIGYVARVRPSLVFDGALVARGRAVVGDEASGR